MIRSSYLDPAEWLTRESLIREYIAAVERHRDPEHTRKAYAAAARARTRNEKAPLRGPSDSGKRQTQTQIRPHGES